MLVETGANISFKRELNTGRAQHQTADRPPSASTLLPSSTPTSAKTDAVTREISRVGDLSDGDSGYPSLNSRISREIELAAPQRTEKLLELLVEIPDAAAKLQEELRLEPPEAVEAAKPDDLIRQGEPASEQTASDDAFRKFVAKAYSE